MNRLYLFALAGLVALIVSCTPKATLTAEPLKIGFVYSGPVGDVGWTHQHDLGRKMVEREFGARVKMVFVENVTESADAERVIRQLVTDGCKMVFTTSFGFMEPTVKVARDFPDVAFEHATGYKTEPRWRSISNSSRRTSATS